MRRHGSSLFPDTDRFAVGDITRFYLNMQISTFFGNISSCTSINDIFYIYFIISFTFNPFLTSSGNICSFEVTDLKNTGMRMRGWWA